MQALDEALALLNDPQIRYQQASEEGRRLINQALFQKLYIREEGVNNADPVAWVQDVHRVAKCKEGRQDDHDPLSGAVGFHKQIWCRAGYNVGTRIASLRISWSR